MSTASAVLARLFGLPAARNAARPPEDFDVIANDGTILKTRVYRPQADGTYPTLLMRVPYGFLGFGTVAEIYAEHGFNSILQACRGTGESGGVFDPLRSERDDGLATLTWIEQQPWFDGRLGLTGPSYLGYAQWAICDALPQRSALATKVSSSDFQSVVFPGGTFALQLWLSWLQIVAGLTDAPMTAGLQIMIGDVERKTLSAASQLPMIDGDVLVTGKQVPFWRDWFANAIDNDGFWEPLDHRKRISASTPPNHFVSGWYDFMLKELITDYQRSVELGHRPYLTIGQWHHISPDLQAESMRQTLPWMRAHLHGDADGLRRNPVRIEIGGGVGWREFPSFPPPGVQDAILHLHEAGRLASAVPEDGQPLRYTYDPSDPTPSVGGAFFAFSGAGPVNNKKLEQRNDVLVFTTDPLAEDVYVIGAPKMTLYAGTDAETTDFFVRICDVSNSGVSTNICDTILRVNSNEMTRDAQGAFELNLTLHPCAHRFRRGHRIRLQVSSGAHPRFARNLGTNEPVGTATRMVRQNQIVFHDSDHPSAIELPVWG